MSQVNTNSIYDASGGSNAVLYGVAAPANSMGFRNRIINGDMRIDQRNAGASVTPTSDGTYTLDRWQSRQSQSSKYSIQRNAGSVTPPAGFTNYLGVTSLSSYSAAASDYFGVIQNIEGFNIADLGWGAAGAQTITLSFWVRSSLTGAFPLALTNDGFSRGYVTTYTINAANTWEYKTITIPGDTTGTWLTNSSAGLRLWFTLGFGSNQITTPNAWGSWIGMGVSGGVNFVGTNGATFYITGVQLEAGSVASPFERRDYGRELIMCQRYYEVTSFSGNDQVFTYASGPAKFFSQNFAYAVEKRTTPTSAYVFSNSKFVIPGTLAVDGTAVHTVNQSTNTVKGYAIQVNGVATISASSAATYCYESSFTGTHSAEL